MKIIVLVVIVVIILTVRADAVLLSPALLYCEKMGFEYSVVDVEGGQMGICTMPDGEECSEWQFLTGECGKEFSYCIREGYEIKTVNDVEKCVSLSLTECSVCVLNDGTEAEIPDLMNLYDDELVPECGDGFCVSGENNDNCPSDCSRDTTDDICETDKDDICDPDCISGEDPDCEYEYAMNWYILLVPTFLIIILVLILFRIRK